MENNLEKNLDFSCSFKVFQAQNLPEFSRRPRGFDPDSLELKRPTFDRFRQTFFRLFSVFLTPKSMKIQLVPFIFSKTGLETMPRL